MDCALHEARGAPGGALADTVATLGGSVVVLVEAGDVAAARSELRARSLAADPGVSLVTAHFDGRALADAGASVFAIPGRCAVLAARAGDGWDFVVTPGATPSAADPTVALSIPVRPAPPQPPDVDPADPNTAWLGVGWAVGIPDLVPAPTVSLRVGPLYAEAGGFTLVVATQVDAHAGVLLPLPSTKRVDPSPRCTSVGAVVGVDQWLFLEGDRGSQATGYELLLVGEQAIAAGHGLWFAARAEAGVGVWDPPLFAPTAPVFPTLSLSASAATGRPLHR